MQYTKTRGGRLWLNYPVPADVRHLFLTSSGKTRTHIEETLGTGDPRGGKLRRDLRIAHWTIEFNRLRGDSGQPVQPAGVGTVVKAMQLREGLRNAREQHGGDSDYQQTVVMELQEHAEDHARAIAAKGEGDAAVDQFHSIATSEPGKLTLLEALAEWNAGEEVRESTKAKRTHAVGELLAFLKVPDCLPSFVTEARAVAYVDWLNKKGLGYSTKQDRLSNFQTLWKFLSKRRQVTRGATPWTDHVLTGKGRATERTGDEELRAFTTDEILRLLRAPANPRAERYTRALFNELHTLGFTTGARLNSLVSLTPAAIELPRGGAGAVWITIENDKTEAGNRTIPVVHPAAVAILKRRVKEVQANPGAAAGSIFPECVPGGPDGRLSWQVQKALGRDRDALGFGPEVNFHSTRRNFMTMMDDNRAEVVHVQRYVGHVVPTLMSKVYVSGSSRDNLLKVAKLVKYPARVEAEFLKAAAAVSARRR
jgi:integrase